MWESQIKKPKTGIVFLPNHVLSINLSTYLPDIENNYNAQSMFVVKKKTICIRNNAIKYHIYKITLGHIAYLLASPFWKLNGPLFIKKNEYIHTKMHYAKIGWNWFSRWRFLNLSMYFCLFIIPL